MTDALPYRRKEVIGDAVLYLGDCREILPTLGKGDAVVTDPPYGLGKKMSGGTWATKASHYKDMHVWDLEAKQEWFDDIAGLHVPAIVWGGNYFLVPPSRCWLSWCKPDFPTMADMELAWTNFDRPAKRFPMSRVPDGAKEHPTQKPIELMKWCLEFLPDAQTILDPFMGSGTTGVACAKLGRKFIGIEIDEGYFEIACERIRKAYAQPDFFVSPPAEKPKQEAFEL